MDIKARIPGKILALNVKEGDTVKARDILGTLEAMKMEQPIPCPKDGTVRVAVMPTNSLDTPNSSPMASPWPLALLYSWSSSHRKPLIRPRYFFLM